MVAIDNILSLLPMLFSTGKTLWEAHSVDTFVDTFLVEESARIKRSKKLQKTEKAPKTIVFSAFLVETTELESVT